MDRKNVVYKPQSGRMVIDPKKISENQPDPFTFGSREIPTMEENPLKQRSNEDGVQIQESTKKNGDRQHEERIKQNPNPQGNEGNPR